MAQNAQSSDVLTRHVTKAERKMRKEGEEALKSDKAIKVSSAVVNNPNAYKYFKRLIDIFKDIDLNDAFYENVLNRYAILLSECDKHSAEIQKQEEMIAELDNDHEEMTAAQYYAVRTEMVKTLNKTESLLGTKRNQLLAIEKENLLTAQAKLRAVPKEKNKEKLSAIEEFRKKYS